MLKWIEVRRKSILTVVGGVISVLIPVLNPDSTLAKTLGFVLIALTGVGVYGVRNGPKPTR
jgi:hypothetical protein